MREAHAPEPKSIARLTIAEMRLLHSFRLFMTDTESHDVTTAV